MRFLLLSTIGLCCFLATSTIVFGQACEPTLYEFQNEQYSGDFHLAARPGGGYFLAGQFDNTAQGTGDDLHLICADIFGNEIWSSTFTWFGNEAATAVRALPDGSAVIVGTIEDPAVVSAAKEILLLKVDPNGNMLWFQTYGALDYLEYHGSDLELLPDGGFVVSGYSVQPGWQAEPGTAVMLLAAADGTEQLWRTREFQVPHDQTGFPEPAQPEIYNVTVLDNGDYLFSGITFAPSDFFPFGAFFTAFRTNATLDVIWEVTDLYDRCLTPTGWDAVEDESGDLFFATDMRFSLCFDIYTYSSMVKVTGDGQNVEFFPIDYTSAGGRSILATSDGHLVIGKQNSIMKVRKDGVVLWESPSVGRFGSNGGNVMVPGPNGGYMLSMHQYDAVRLVEFDSLGNNCRAQLGGQVFYDQDGDCEQDIDEPLAQDIVVELNGQEFRNTSSLGFYNFQADAGNFEITANPPNELWQVGCPPSANHTIEVLGPVSTRQDLNFGLQPTEQCVLLDVDVRLSRARVCTDQLVSIQYCNLGTVDADGAYVELTLDPALVFVDAQVPVTMVGDELHLFVGNVGIGECGSFNVQVFVDCVAALGSQTCTAAQIYPEGTCTSVFTDATDVDCQEIRNSYDPNDKLVVAQNAEGCWSSALDELEYTIRFQNTGNDTAYQVVIIDTLSEDLDLSTFRPGPATHPYNVRLLHDRQVMFSFPNINLLDSTSNVLASQGFVQFSIHPSVDISDGTLIRNRAGIYFDNNPPIITPYSELLHCDGSPLTLVAVEVEDITDCETQNGRIRIVGTGGEGAFEYSIDGGESWQTDSLFTNVAAGSYSILLRDESGTTVDHEENPVRVTELVPSIVGLHPIAPSSCGGNTGRIMLEIDTEVPSQYSIDGGMNWFSGTTIFGLTAGTYEVLVANSCGNGDSQTVEVPARVPPMITEVNHTDPDCDGMNGSIVISATGELALRYSIDGGETWNLNNTFSDLTSGTYQPVVSYGANNCEVSADEEVVLMAGDPLPEDVQATIADLSSCVVPDGQITFTGGLASTLYSIDGGASYQAAASFESLPAGIYTLAISNGCGLADTLQEVELLEPVPPMIADVITGGADCQTATGFLQIQAGTGTGLTYSIDGWMTSQDTGEFLDLLPGTYTALTRDNVGCEAEPYTVEIVGTPKPDILEVITGGADCETATGFLHIETGTGTGLTYSIDGWATSQNTGEFTDLPPGTYTAQVRNDAGCEAEPYVVAIEGSPKPEILDVVAGGADCETATGFLHIETDMGTDLTYSIDGWATSQNTGEFTDLPPGTYTALVRNDAGCEAEPYVVEIEGSPKPEILDVVAGGADCETATGFLQIEVEHGAGVSYSIDGWVSSQLSPEFMGLSADVYTVQVRNDSTGCEAEPYTLTLEGTPKPVITDFDLEHPSCGASDGFISLSVTGGEGFLYSINGGVSGQDSGAFLNLPAGEYSVLVTNADDCHSDLLGLVLTAPTPPQIEAVEAVQPNCENALGSILILASGEEELSYSINGPDGPWLPDSSFVDLPAGTYEVLVANHLQLCQVAFPENPLQLQEATFPQVDSVQTFDATGGSTADGQILVFASGSDELQYSIDGGQNWQNTATFNNLLPGTYTITVALGDLSCSVEWGEVVVSFTNSTQDLSTLGVSDLRLYPNPTAASALLEMNLSTQQRVEVQLYAPTGQMLNQYQVVYTDRYQEHIELAALPAGLYYLKVQVGQAVFYQKLMKQ